MNHRDRAQRQAAKTKRRKVRKDKRMLHCKKSVKKATIRKRDEAVMTAMRQGVPVGW